MRVFCKDGDHAFAVADKAGSFLVVDLGIAAWCAHGLPDYPASVTVWV